MKKILTVLAVLLIITGCSSSADKAYEERLKKYEAYWNVLLNEDKFQSVSRNFDIQVEFLKEENEYNYYIAVDNQKIAMYDVEIMVVEDKEPYDKKGEMLPNAGIFEGEYNLIPNQIRETKGFKGGIGVAKLNVGKPEVNIRVLVSWKNYTKLETSKEVFEYNLKYTEPVVETPPADTETDTGDAG